MKLWNGMVITELDNEYLLVPTGVASKHLSEMVRLNDSAEFIVRQFQKETTIPEVVDAMLEEYDAERPLVEEYVADIVEKLREIGAFEE